MASSTQVHGVRSEDTVEHCMHVYKCTTGVRYIEREVVLRGHLRGTNICTGHNMATASHTVSMFVPRDAERPHAYTRAHTVTTHAETHTHHTTPH